ncbi:MAG: tetratricopeptide repeat protein [Methanophagales archaeon]|nr:tetratricopeptide repeat protein [Methanophagales archaeon]
MVIKIMLVKDQQSTREGGTMNLSSSVHFGIGNSCLARRQFELAIEYYDKALTINPSFTDAWYNKGKCLAEMKRWTEALVCYKKVLHLEPPTAELLRVIGDILSELGKFEKAKSINDKLANVWNSKGFTLAGMGKIEEALDSYDRALSLDDRNALILLNKANLLVDMQRLEEALVCLDKATKIDPKYVEAWYNKALVLVRMNNYREALKCCEKILKIRPNHEMAKRLKLNCVSKLDADMKKKFEQFRNSIFKRAYDQAISEYGSWEKYKKEQWKSFLYYGPEDLIDLALALLSSSYRVKYPIPAIDLAAYTIKKFNLDIRLANMPVVGTRFNTRTNENDPAQVVSLKAKFDKVSEWQLHFGGHILARCALLSDDPSSYLSKLAQNIDPPHDVILFAEREFNKIINHQCPYEEEAEKEVDKKTEQQSNYRNKALKEAMNFFYKESSPSHELQQTIEAEVRIEKDIANISKELM